MITKIVLILLGLLTGFVLTITFQFIFKKIKIKSRRKKMFEQAKELMDYYEKTSDWRNF